MSNVVIYFNLCILIIRSISKSFTMAFLYKNIRLLLAVIGLLCTMALPIQAQLNASLSITGNNSPMVSDWIGSFRTNRIFVNVVNPTMQEYRGFLRVQIYNASGGLIARTVDFRQTQFNFGQGATTLELADVISTDPAAGHAEVIDMSIASYVLAGIIPDGNYRICVEVVDPDTFRPLVSMPTCRFLTITGLQPPVLMTPANGTELRAAARPILRWHGLSPKPSFMPTYRVQVFEVVRGQSPEIAVRVNVPIMEQNVMGMTQLVWPASYELPRPGYQYVWTVQALDENFNPIGTENGFAAPFTFKMGGTPIAGEDPLMGIGEEEEKAEEQTAATAQPGNVLITGTITSAYGEKRVIGDAVLEVSYQMAEDMIQGNSTPRKQDVTADGKGVYSFEVPANTIVTINPKVEGYKSADPIELLADRDLSANNIGLMPLPGSISGNISINGSNLSPEGVVVEAFKKREDGKEEAIGSAKADASGAYRIENLMPGFYVIRVNDPKYIEYESEVELRAEGEQGGPNRGKRVRYKAYIKVKRNGNTEHNINLEAFTASISGRLTYDGRAMPTGKVYILDQSQYRRFMAGEGANVLRDAYGVTDVSQDGSYELENITIHDRGNETENYIALGVNPGWGSSWIRYPHWSGHNSFAIDINAPTQRGVDIELQDARKTITGILTKDGEEAAASAWIKVHFENGSSDWLRTDGNGRYIYGNMKPDLIPKKVEAYVSGLGYKTVEVPADKQQKSFINLNIAMKGIQHTIKGRITDQSDDAVEGAKVAYSNHGEELLGEGTTDENGNYSITFPEGLDMAGWKQVEITYNDDLTKEEIKVRTSSGWSADFEIEKLGTRNFSFYFTNAKDRSTVNETATVVFKDPSGEVVAEKEVKNRQSGGVQLKRSWHKKELTIEVDVLGFKPVSFSESIDDLYGLGFIPKFLTLEPAKPKADIRILVVDKVTKEPIAGASYSTSSSVNSCYSWGCAGGGGSLSGGTPDPTTNTEGRGIIEDYEVPPIGKYDVTPDGGYKILNAYLTARARGYKQGRVTLNETRRSRRGEPESVFKPEVSMQTIDLVIELEKEEEFKKPSSIFGFPCTVTNFTRKSNGNYSVNGRITVPTNQNVSPRSNNSSIDFRSWELTKDGVPVRSEYSLGSRLSVEVFGVEASLRSPQLKKRDNRNDRGMIVGTVEISGGLRVSGTSSKQFGKVTLGTSANPVTILSSGNSSSVAVKFQKDGKIDKREFSISSSTGKLDGDGIKINVTTEILDTEVSGELHIKEGSQRWQIHGFDSDSDIVIESDDRQTFQLKAKLFFSGGLFKLSPTTIKILGGGVNLKTQYGNAITVNKEGEIGDTRLSVASGSQLEMVKDVAFSMYKIDLSSDDGDLVATMDMTSKLKLLKEGLGFAVYAKSNGSVGGSLAAPLELSLYSPSGGGKLPGVTATLSEIELWYGPSDRGLRVVGGLGIGFSQVSIGGELDVEYNNEDGFKLNAASVEAEFSEALSISGGVAFGEEFKGKEYKVIGEIEVTMPGLGPNPKKGITVGSVFKYNSGRDFAIDFKASGLKVIIAPSPADLVLTGIRGGVTRDQNLWKVRLGGSFTYSAIPPQQLRIDGDAEITAGQNKEGKVVAKLNLRAKVYFFEPFLTDPVGEGQLVLSISPKAYIEGNIRAGLELEPLMSSNASLSLYLGQHKYYDNQLVYRLTGKATFRTLGKDNVRGNIGIGNYLREKLSGSGVPNEGFYFDVYAKVEKQGVFKETLEIDSKIALDKNFNALGRVGVEYNVKREVGVSSLSVGLKGRVRAEMELRLSRGRFQSLKGAASLSLEGNVGGSCSVSCRGTSLQTEFCPSIDINCSWPCCGRVFGSCICRRPSCDVTLPGAAACVGVRASFELNRNGRFSLDL